MKNLLKISLDLGLLSLTPILSWFLLSLIVDKSLLSAFTITYPLQCIYGILNAIFSTGANLCKVKDRNKNATMSGLIIGIILAIVIYGYFIVNIDQYITFMNMDAAFYRTFCTYAIFMLLYQTIFSFILDKLYYENKNTLANKYSTIFNLLNFTVVIGVALLTKNHLIITGVTILVMGIFTLYVVARNWSKFHFRLNIFHCIKYNASSLISSSFAFVGYLFGISNALDFGPQYGLAITFTSLITDTQWDVLDSVTTLAKVEISQKRFNYKKSLRNAYKLVFLLYLTIAAMFFSLYWFYELDLAITLIFLGVQILDFILSPAYYLRNTYLHLNWSAGKNSINRIIARACRLYCAFLPTPFCEDIGQLIGTFYQVFTTKFFFNRNFIVDKNGYIRHRPTRRQLKARYRYNDIIIDENE